jgi:hypothetical protein
MVVSVVLRFGAPPFSARAARDEAISSNPYRFSATPYRMTSLSFQKLSTNTCGWFSINAVSYLSKVAFNSANTAGRLTSLRAMVTAFS